MFFYQKKALYPQPTAVNNDGKITLTETNLSYSI